jgi:hypothetical protein
MMERVDVTKITKGHTTVLGCSNSRWMKRATFVNERHDPNHNPNHLLSKNNTKKKTTTENKQVFFYFLFLTHRMEEETEILLYSSDSEIVLSNMSIINNQ